MDVMRMLSDIVRTTRVPNHIDPVAAFALAVAVTLLVDCWIVVLMIAASFRPKQNVVPGRQGDDTVATKRSRAA